MPASFSLCTSFSWWSFKATVIALNWRASAPNSSGASMSKRVSRSPRARRAALAWSRATGRATERST